MTTKSLAFARFTQFFRVIDELPFPNTDFLKNRTDYDYILGKIYVNDAKKELTYVTDLIECSHLGSQPTVNKRIHELIHFGMIKEQLCEDRRRKSLQLSALGQHYLDSCSELMLQSIAASQSFTFVNGFYIKDST